MRRPFSAFPPPLPLPPAGWPHPDFPCRRMTDTINAPFTRRFVIYEKGIEDEIEIVSPMEAGGLKSEQFLKMNPHGKVRPWLLPFYIYFQMCPTIFYFLHTSIFYRVYLTVLYFLCIRLFSISYHFTAVPIGNSYILLTLFVVVSVLCC